MIKTLTCTLCRSCLQLQALQDHTFLPGLPDSKSINLPSFWISSFHLVGHPHPKLWLTAPLAALEVDPGMKTWSLMSTRTSIIIVFLSLSFIILIWQTKLFLLQAAARVSDTNHFHFPIQTDSPWNFYDFQTTFGCSHHCHLPGCL